MLRSTAWPSNRGTVLLPSLTRRRYASRLLTAVTLAISIALSVACQDGSRSVAAEARGAGGDPLALSSAPGAPSIVAEVPAVASAAGLALLRPDDLDTAD